MEAVGELYGSSFDLVLRRPRSVLVALLSETAVVLAAGLYFSVAVGAAVHVPLSRLTAAFPFAVPTALPSLGDVMRAPSMLGARVDLLVFLALAFPVLAWAEGGFIGVLNRRFLQESDLDRAERRDWTLEELKAVFLSEARRHLPALLVLKLIVAAVLLLPLLLTPLPYFRNFALGALIVEFVLMYAPFVVVREGAGALDAIRASFTAVSDYLATSLVALLFLLLTTGGFAAALGALAPYAGGWIVPLALVVYAPVGTALSLFLLRVYAAMRPTEQLPAAIPSAAPSDAT